MKNKKLKPHELGIDEIMKKIAKAFNRSLLRQLRKQTTKPKTK
jgi:hypothetical protein